MNGERKKQVALITFHFPYNCGAALQCWALQTVIERHGYDVQVIDYEPDYHRNRYTPWENPLITAETRMRNSRKIRALAWIKGFALGAASYLHYGENRIRERKFRTFMHDRLHMTRLYKTIGELREDPPQAQTYVTGSDQIWNPHITEGFDEAYFLRFGSASTRRISYAVGADFSDEKADVSRLPELLESMDVISLREEKCRDMIRASARQGVPMHISLDPTLLLSAEDYEAIEREPENPPENYVFTYVMPNESAQEVLEAAQTIAQQMGARVVHASGGRQQGVRNLPQDSRICSPEEFLWYVRHARYVVTNSFHGTVFSVILHKGFSVVPHTKTGNRTTELLERLGLQERVAAHAQQAAAIWKAQADAPKEQDALSELRRESTAFLIRHIAG